MTKWRTLLRVIAEDKDGSIWLVAPGWNSKLAFLLERERIGIPVHVGDRLHARVNLAAEQAMDLDPTDFEL